MADISAIGGFFSLQIGPADTGWRPLTELLGDKAVLDERVTLVADRLGASERRIAASILFQGLAARFLSPPFGVAAVHGLLVDFTPDRLHWRPVPSGPLPLRTVHADATRVWSARCTADPGDVTAPHAESPGEVTRTAGPTGPHEASPAEVTRTAGLTAPHEASPGEVTQTAGPTGRRTASPGELAEGLYRMVVEGVLEPLAGTLREIVKIAPGLLWGNAASCVAEAMRAVERERAGAAETAGALGRALLEIGRLRGNGELAEPAPGHTFFVRRSCCLYYRVAPDALCGDCALLDPEVRREQWARAVRHGGGAG
ncbi:(2Fe-2S)-binding protein [Sinosporangium siamense]|uniref:(2Fe-2S)-binding protein n=1 Tax=Sinosporangium siamense TaxID=1367973 RepID=UPI00194DCD7B|nr:(2Fe-2S)-binding protein [Sinosporangium siamense]